MTGRKSRVAAHIKRKVIGEALAFRGKKRADPRRVRRALDRAIQEAEISGQDVRVPVEFARVLRSELDYVPKPQGRPQPAPAEAALRQLVASRYKSLIDQSVPSNDALSTIKGELQGLGRYVEDETIKKWAYYTPEH
jgi:hypothetical protein